MKNPIEILNLFSTEISIAETHLEIVKTITGALKDISENKLDKKIESYLIFAFQAHSITCLSCVSKLFDKREDSHSIYSVLDFVDEKKIDMFQKQLDGTFKEYMLYEKFRNKFQQHIDNKVDYYALSHLIIDEWTNGKLNTILENLSKLIGEIGLAIKEQIGDTELVYSRTFIGVDSGLKIILNKFIKR